MATRAKKTAPKKKATPKKKAAPAKKPAAKRTAAPKKKAAKPTLTDWSKLSDDELFREPVEMGPGCDHGFLLQYPPTVFSWGWYWFTSPEDRLAYVKEVARRFSGDDAAVQEALAEIDENIGASGEEREFTDVGCWDGTIDWVGTLRDLTHGSSKTALKCRKDFWTSSPHYSGPARPPKSVIPPQLLTDFLWSLEQEP